MNRCLRLIFKIVFKTKLNSMQLNKINIIALLDNLNGSPEINLILIKPPRLSCIRNTSLDSQTQLPGPIWIPHISS